MSLAILFNGQGAHYKGMGQDFVETYPEAQVVFEKVEKMTNYPVREWITEDFDALAQTQYAQVAIAATSLAIYESIQNKLPAIEYMAGLSLGEYSSLIASDMLSFEDGFNLIKTRGQLMTKHCETLRETTEIVMEAVIKMPLTEIQEVLDLVNEDEELVYLANLNSSTQVTVAGTKEAVDEFKAIAKERGYRKIMPLKVEGPFHTPYMAPVQNPYLKAVNAYEFKTGKAQVVSNTTVTTHVVDEVNDLLVRHLVEPVRWQETIDYLVDQGITKVIQIGPGKTLANLLKREKNAPETLVIDKISDVEKIEDFIGG